jgi:hypothetical protein
VQHLMHRAVPSACEDNICATHDCLPSLIGRRTRCRCRRYIDLMPEA